MDGLLPVLSYSEERSLNYYTMVVSYNQEKHWRRDNDARHC